MTHAQKRRDGINRKRLARKLAVAADLGQPPRIRKSAARYAAALAERLGLIVRPERCQWCRRRLRLERHHPEHREPLALLWLCRPCHDIADRMSLSEATA